MIIDTKNGVLTFNNGLKFSPKQSLEKFIELTPENLITKSGKLTNGKYAFVLENINIEKLDFPIKILAVFGETNLEKLIISKYNSKDDDMRAIATKDYQLGLFDKFNVLLKNLLNTELNESGMYDYKWAKVQLILDVENNDTGIFIVYDYFK